MSQFLKLHPHTAQLLVIIAVITGGAGVNVVQTERTGVKLEDRLAVLEYRLACLERPGACPRTPSPNVAQVTP